MFVLKMTETLLKCSYSVSDISKWIK